MMGTRARPTKEAGTSAKVPENEGKRIPDKQKKVKFAGVEIPVKKILKEVKRPEKAVEEASKGTSEVRRRSVEIEDIEDEEEQERKRQQRKEGSATRYIIEEMARLEEDDEEIGRREVPKNTKEPSRRPFDSVPNQQREPLPHNTPPERRQTSENRPPKSVPLRQASGPPEEALAEKLATCLFESKVDLSEAELLAISPEVRRIMIRKARNQRVKPRVRTSAEVFNAVSVDSTEESKGVRVLTKYIDVADIQLPPEEMFEVLKYDRDGLKAGSIVQRDVVQCFRNDMSEGDERKDMVIVASNGNGLRAIYPSINGATPDVECILDDGSQIVAVDRLVAAGLDIAWDPKLRIQMQDVHGGVSWTLGLAKNVPFKIGHLTIYLQCHIQDKAPFEVLIGRPFHVLTESEVKNWGNGDQEITITDPNTDEKCTINSKPRGSRKRRSSIDTSRYARPELKTEEGGQKKENEEAGNFRASMI